MEEEILFTSSGREVVIVNTFNDNKKTYCNYYYKNDWRDDIYVTEKSRLYKKEETDIYLKKAKLDELQKDTEKAVKKIQDDAIKSLVTRIKINSVFGEVKDGSVGLAIAKELEKIILKKESL